MKVLLVQIAWAATRKKDSFFKAKYQSLVVRRGKKRALIAVGHKILCVIYHVLKKKEAYKELGADFLEKYRQSKRLKTITKELKELGLELKQTA